MDFYWWPYLYERMTWWWCMPYKQSNSSQTTQVKQLHKKIYLWVWDPLYTMKGFYREFPSLWPVKHLFNQGYICQCITSNAYYWKGSKAWQCNNLKNEKRVMEFYWWTYLYERMTRLVVPYKQSNSLKQVRSNCYRKTLI